MDWQYKVVKIARGMKGEWFSFPTAATFRTESEAVAYAERFASEQGKFHVSGARITVRTRKGNRTIHSFDPAKGLTDYQGSEG